MSAKAVPARLDRPVPPGKETPRDSPKKLAAVVSEFQPDAVEIEERIPPRIARLTLYAVTAMIAGGVAWASVSSMDEIVVAPGKLITTQPTIVVQPLETSIIRAIDVEVGDVVRAGQTLAKLDSTFTQADVDQQRGRFRAFDSQVRRIEAELSGADYSKSAGSSPDEVLQGRLFGQRHAFFVAQIQNYDQQIASRAAAIDSSRSQEPILQDRRETLLQIEAARETLYRNQTGSLLNLLTSKDARLDVDSGLERLRGDVSEGEHVLAKLRADRQAFIEDFRRATMEQLVELRSQREAAAEELKKMELRRQMVVLTAPADAVVLDLAQRSIGSVVREAEPVVTLVPLNVRLEAEVSVNTRDIGHVDTDDPVRVKIDAYPYQKFGTATGTIRTISRDAFARDPKEGSTGDASLPFFKARIALEEDSIRDDAGPVRLLPGMTVNAEIKVGHRSVLSYFLHPLLRGLEESLREP